MGNLCAKFEVCIYTRDEEMKGGQNVANEMICGI